MDTPERYGPRYVEITDALLRWIEDGRPLQQFCRQEGNPSRSVLYRWLEQDEDFAALFARARDLGADAIAEEALKIADTPVMGETTTTSDKDGTTIRREDMVAHRKLQVWTRLQLLAKWNPKKYGDKLAIGGDGGAPIPLRISSSDGDL